MLRDSPRNSKFRKQITLILLGAAVVYLVGNASVGLWDRDEPRYAQTSRQMLQSGDWIVPRFLDEIRTAKPPLIYWCQAGAMKLFGDTAFAARFPSAVAMLLTLSFLAIVLPRAIGRRRTVWVVFILASSGMVIAAAKMAMTDSVLLLWITIAQERLYQILRGRGTWGVWVAMGIAVGCAGLTKGPVVLGVMGMTVLVLGALRLQDRRRKYSGPDPLKLIVSIAIVALICLPWIILINRREPKFLPTIIGHDLVERVKSGLEGHSGPPGYYLLTIWGTYFPWSLFLPAAIAFAWRRRDHPLVRFALASVIGPWLMFELIQTKLVHYVLPIFPPLALLTARALQARRVDPGLKIIAVWSALIAMIAAAPLVISLARGLDLFSTLVSLMIAFVGIEMGRSVFIAFRARKLLVAASAMGIGTLMFLGISYGLWSPRVPDIRMSQRVAQVLHREGATHEGDVIMIGYKEPSLAFYQGGTIREESDNAFLAHTDASRWPQWVVITRELWDATPQTLRSRFEVVDFARGWWYANMGKRVEVLVAHRRYRSISLASDRLIEKMLLDGNGLPDFAAACADANAASPR